jgi:hypothetical protein
MDRNFWDPTTPQGFIDLLRDGSVVELCIYSFPLSAKGRDQVRADVEEANRIWCQRGINVQAIHWERLDPLPPVTGPLDLNSANLAGQIPAGRDVTPEMRNQLFGIGQPNCPRVPPTNPVPVYYIPEAAFGVGTTGRHAAQKAVTNSEFQAPARCRSI